MQRKQPEHSSRKEERYAAAMTKCTWRWLRQHIMHARVLHGTRPHSTAAAAAEVQ
jgi:hypothetical protein